MSSADFQSAVSQNSILPGVRKQPISLGTRKPCRLEIRDTADWKFALRPQAWRRILIAPSYRLSLAAADFPGQGFARQARDEQRHRHRGQQTNAIQDPLASRAVAMPGADVDHRTEIH